MVPGQVIGDFNIIKDIGPGRPPGVINTFYGPFCFQRTKGRYGHRIIPAVVAPTYTIGPTKPWAVLVAVPTVQIAIYDNLNVRSSLKTDIPVI